MLRHSMENYSFLLYKRIASCAGRANIKNGAGPFEGTRAAGISHRRGSWLACRREMLLNRQKVWPHAMGLEASAVLGMTSRCAEHCHLVSA
jgi:hypothetical protein